MKPIVGNRKLTLVGYGFVGKAMHHVLHKWHEIKIVDPQYTIQEIEDDSDGYIICVPTPSSHDGSCDFSIVEDVVRRCPKGKPILIKSTISLEGWRNLHQYEKSLNFSPEFLTAANSILDAESKEHMLLGGPDTDFWSGVFLMYKKILAPIEELILTKYIINCFLASKVSFFNDIYKLCKATNVDYDKVCDLVQTDDRIGSSHMQVPGPDGQMGFGGMCFPKDTKALIHTGIHFRSPMTLLNEIVALNDLVRDDDEPL